MAWNGFSFCDRPVRSPRYLVSGYDYLTSETCVRKLRVIRRSRKPLSPDRYCRIERKMRAFADQIGIDMDELDLLLWSRKTGKILK